MRLVSFVSTAVLCSLFLIFAIANGFGVTEITEQKPQVLAASDIKFTPSGDDFIDSVNKLRVSENTPFLEVDNRLNKIASNRLEDMINRKYYAHQNPDGLTYDAYFETLPSYSCENLNLTPENSNLATIKDWLNSPKHRECLLSARVNKIGYAKSEIPGLDGSNLFVLILSTN